MSEKLTMETTNSQNFSKVATNEKNNKVFHYYSAVIFFDKTPFLLLKKI